MIEVAWLWLFLDTPRADAPRSWRFWSEVTGCDLSPTRGDDSRFATLLPARGDPWLKVQAVREGAGGIHLDLDVADVHAAARHAQSLGAARTGSLGDTVVVLRSPGGLAFCVTTWLGESRQERRGAPELVDQVCLDCPADAHEAEVRFWAALTGWEPQRCEEPELSFLEPPPGIPVRLLFQRLGEPAGPVRAHADLACTDRAAAVARHTAAGARVVRPHTGWTVMADPVGRVYCLTDRDPTRGAAAQA